MNKQKIYSQIQESINNSEKILLCLHPSPDGDSLGSCLAMYWFLKSIGKKPTVISGDSSSPSYLSCLPGFKEIVNKNFSQIKLTNFDLFIGIDSSSLSQVTKQTEIVFPSHLKTINIDHHDTNTNWANINLVDHSSPAASQILHDLLKFFKAEITSQMAINLFIGIYTDSGGFKYSKTNNHTFEVVTDLVRICPSFTDIIFKIENNETPGRIFYKAIALKNISLHFNDNLAISSVGRIELSQKNINTEDTEKSDIGNVLKSVCGWNIGACLTETETNVCNLSLRTRDPVKYDVSKLAQALGGGGHPAAAGAQIKKPLDQAKKELIEVTGQLFFKNG